MLRADRDFQLLARKNQVRVTRTRLPNMTAGGPVGTARMITFRQKWQNSVKAPSGTVTRISVFLRSVNAHQGALLLKINPTDA